MTIVPAQELAYRLKVRRRLTLDLFTRHGPFWELVAALRKEWSVTAPATLPSEPRFRYSGIPIRFHLPEEPASSPYRRLGEFIDRVELNPEAATATEAVALDYLKELPWQPLTLAENEAYLRASRFLMHIRELWRVAIPEDVRNGSNVEGWAPWLTFLSACILFDPPADQLLEFAEHDDWKAARIEWPAVWQESGPVAAAALHMQRYFQTGSTDDYEHATELHVQSWRASESAPFPRGKRGRPSDPLQDVQAAIWRNNGMSTADIARRIDRGVRDNSDTYDPDSPSFRERSDAAEDAVKRGAAILDDRAAWARIISE